MKICLSILLLLLSYFPGNAQYRQPKDSKRSAFSPSLEYAVSVQHLNIEQGLSNRFVNSIFQDSKGFIWFATNSGVNRWDGYEMKVFAENVAVWSVMEDAYGRIWFRYSFDENFFLGYPEKFPLHLNALPNDTLLPTEWTLVANMEGSILLQSKKDGSIYSYNNRLIAHPAVNRYLANSNVVPIAPISKDRFWVAIGNAIQLMDLDGKIYEKTPIANGQKQLIPPELSNLIYSSLQIKTNNGIIWEGKTHQLQAKDRNGKVIFDFYDYLGSTPPSSNFIIDEHNNAWICSDNGVYRVSINPSPFATYLNAQSTPRYSVRGMLLRNDSLLVHTYGGSKMVSVASGGFVPLKNTPSHIGQAIGNFLDKDSILFWGEGIGIRRYDLRSGQYQFFERKSISDISYLPYRDKKSGTLWVAGNKRTHILNEGSGQIEDIQFEGGLQPIYIRHFFEDEKGLWLVARNGLFLTDALTRKLISVYTEKNNIFPFTQFNHLHKDKQGIYWLATQGNGLLRWNPEDGSYKTYGRKEGFLSQVVYSVHEDRQGRLWLPTEYGLVLFDKTTETTHVFLEQDGLTHNEFNGYSYHEGSDGRFYFGGLNGLIAFHPDSVFIDPNINSAPLLLTAIYVSDDNKESNQTDITKAVQQSNVLVLQPSNKSVTVNFAYLDYGSHPNIQYAYKIEGLDKEWIYQRGNSLHFNSLPSGQYQLRIKAKGKNNVWSANEIVLPITVLKPYYLRWSFLLGASAFVGLLLYSLFRYRTYRLRLDAKRLERQVIHRTKTIVQQKDDLERLYQTKGRLYAIIAHDLRDPVEAFKGFAGKIKYLLKKQDMQQVIRLATFVENAAVELSKLLDNLLQWAQLQQKDLPFKPEFHNIENLIKECFGSLQLIATNKNIRLEYEGTPGIEVYGDYHMLTIVFRNLIDNALKFSPTNAVIKVSASSDQQKTNITFQDFGIGMSPEQLETLFLVKMKTTSEGTLGEKGTGLGLPLCKELLDVHGAAVAVDSAPEEGTTISLSFLTKVEVESTVP